MAPSNAFTQSIKPSSLTELKNVEVFKDFMANFEGDCKLFIASTSDLKEIDCMFKNISKYLQDRNLLDSLIERINVHSRFSELRLAPVEAHLDYFYKSWVLSEKQIGAEYEALTAKKYQDILKENLSTLSEKERSIVREILNKSTQNYISLVVGVSGLINQIFFVLESQCKIICSLTCFPFAISYSKDNLIQHAEVWLTLKKIGKLGSDHEDCAICRMQEKCSYSIDFAALANVYCYAIKVRMLADYDRFFYDNSVWQHLKAYFDNLKSVIVCQQTISKKYVVG
jgi:hypothetical protein